MWHNSNWRQEHSPSLPSLGTVAQFTTFWMRYENTFFVLLVHNIMSISPDKVLRARLSFIKQSWYYWGIYTNVNKKFVTQYTNTNLIVVFSKIKYNGPFHSIHTVSFSLVSTCSPLQTFHQSWPGNENVEMTSGLSFLQRHLSLFPAAYTHLQRSETFSAGIVFANRSAGIERKDEKEQ